MSINFSEPKCQDQTNKKIFGLRDDKPGERARLDEKEGEKWIAVVHNEDRYEVVFTAVDNCIETKRADGKMDRRCDGILTYLSNIIFVELKKSDNGGTTWITDAEKQLRTTINYFEETEEAESFTQKIAYIANNDRPKFRHSQTRRMNQFLIDTGYVLRIVNRIILD
jgi:hypothetical protein